MHMLCKSFLMSEKFEGPHGHYLLKEGFHHVKYALNRLLVDTTWRCTWKPTLSESLPNADIEEIVTNISSKPQSWRHISFSTAERRVKSVTPHKREAHGHVNNVLRWVYIWNNIKADFRKIYFLLVHELDQQCASSCASSIESFDQIKLGPTISPHGGDNMLARFEAGVNTFPHISQIKYVLLIICIFWMESRKCSN